MSLRSALAGALRDAMRQRDKPAVAALRSLSARWANAEAVPMETMPRAGAVEGSALGVGAADAERRVLTVEDLVHLAEAEVAELESAAVERDRLGRREDAADLRRQAAVILRLLNDSRE